MSKQNYNESLNRLLKDEGGYTNNPNDKGGPTNFGITIADYHLYINASGTASDVKNMKLEDAKTIYRTKYWNALGCDDLPSGVDYCVFDYGVNSGVGRARKVLAQFKSITDPVKLINAICDERLRFLKAIRGGSDWQHFGKGWQRRVDGVRTNALRMAQNKTAGGATSAGGVVVAGGTIAAATPHNYWPYIVAATMVIAVIAYVGYSYYEWTKSDAYKHLHETK